MKILIRVISDPPEVIVHEATNNTDDIVYTLQQVEKIEASFQFQCTHIFVTCIFFIKNENFRPIILIFCSIQKGNIVLGDGCWRPNAVVTSLRCW